MGGGTGSSKLWTRLQSILDKIVVTYSRSWVGKNAANKQCVACKNKTRTVLFGDKEMCYECVTVDIENTTIKEFIEIYLYLTNEEAFTKYKKTTTCLIKSYTQVLISDTDLFPKELPDKLSFIQSVIAYGIYYLIFEEQ